MKARNAVRLVVALLISGCGAPALEPAPAPAAPEGVAADSTCSGSDPATGCDDCNPCTSDANCTPCSALPEGERDSDHCTADDELPPFCAGHTGCFHVALSTPAGQLDDCFPVADAAVAHAGVCSTGVCVEDPR